MNFLTRPLKRVLQWPPIARLPVRVRSGVAEGARWSFFPWTAYWRGTHEPEVQKLLAELWDWKGKHVWDLGSHYGLFAVGLGRRVGAQGSVAAFEPNPLSYSRLQLHIARNHLRWVKAFPLALSNVTESQRFFAYKGLESTSTHLAYEGETWDPSIPTITVTTCRLDDLVAAGKIHAPDFIKLDVEGHGHKALLGAEQTLRAHRPTLLLAIHSHAEREGIKALLDPLRYNYVPVLPDAPPDLQCAFDYLARPL
ncbi:FkbM family methyltransferase [Oleiharenicola lentus]|uniref:FkbM family methyltransferase n=1 Tax=Oleiharenicola lentus TaxID=2508720 RepID=UPI003F67B7E1